ncbi:MULTISPECIES: LysR substrate-binding domain-containing protein [unclassified Acidovorax]|jgi:DNA-binding transcriptional LysR family regulator|uniref:LysR substrate-binding domain-containing protein n=1 Tax=unclassified Acidovorax TaxID=2684926 RepID=UPI000B4007EC|nr:MULTISPECIES: LysR substrate-binding domain-containing protein [unclassified Acidovorax]MBP3981326.1 LysR family transcriptional regulator [Acidovorax sp. JG5]
MKIRQLEAFREVMRWQTVTRAADALHVSQPAVTRLITDLEESVGFPLFLRIKGRLQPTSEAQVLYEEVERSLIGVERIARTAEDIRQLQRGLLSIAAAPAMALSFLPRAIASFLKAHKDVRVSLANHSSRTVMDMVMGERCDVGFVILSMGHIGAHGELLLSTRSVCALPSDHRLAGHKVIRPVDLAGEAFLSYPPEPDLRLKLDALFASYGIERVLQVETQVSAGLIAMVAAGLGVAVVDAVSAMEYGERGVVFLPFEPTMLTDFTVLTPARRGPSMLVSEFVEHVRDFAHQELDPRFIVA